eukprot:NODE_648_length_824_cov_596.788387_g491_i0.p1 GENE.NODE_648_length_824_cov_596.788387_g491_i0~~NODE_648_length_824_cov_596.788387_g491_i0.p1  ORF type:complete len:221 (-),score=55.32 NODE_648_length_824_cov_596.788387_g491_i0:161-799(-)
MGPAYRILVHQVAVRKRKLATPHNPPPKAAATDRKLLCVIQDTFAQHGILRHSICTPSALQAAVQDTDIWAIVWRWVATSPGLYLDVYRDSRNNQQWINESAGNMLVYLRPGRPEIRVGLIRRYETAKHIRHLFYVVPDNTSCVPTQAEDGGEAEDAQPMEMVAAANIFGILVLHQEKIDSGQLPQFARLDDQTAYGDQGLGKIVVESATGQ